VLAGGGHAALEAALRDDGMAARDRALFTQLVNGSIKMRRALDWSLSRYLKRPLESLTSELRWTLRLGAYQLLYLERVPAHSAVDESVKLARRTGHAGTAAVANAVLRKLAAQPVRPPVPRPGDGPDVLGSYASLPDWLAGHLIERFGAETALRIADGVNQMPRRAARVNTLVTTVAEMTSKLESAGVDVGPSRYGIPDCLVLARTPPASATMLNRLIRSGRLTMQSEESQLAVHLLDPRPGDTVLDVCAGRGVKTGAIVQRRPTSVHALDDDPTKLAVLAQEMVRIDGLMPEVVCADATRAYTTVNMPASFDAVLVDAPCSGIGTIGRRADLRWAKSSSDPVRLAPTQGAILRQAAASVKPGGRLLYVTCSTDAREDEDIIRTFVAQHPEFRVAALPIVAPVGAIISMDAFALTKPGIDGADGFFYAKLERSAR